MNRRSLTRSLAAVLKGSDSVGFRVIAALAGVKVLLVAVAIISMAGGYDRANVYAGEQSAASTSAVAEAPIHESLKTSDEQRAMLEAVSRRTKELDERQRELDIKEKRLNELKSSVQARIDELNRLYDKVDEVASKINEYKGERIRRLVKIYESMAPEEAAPRIEKLNEKTAVMILAQMKEKSAAKILGLVEVSKSVKLSQSLKMRDKL